MRNWVEGFLMAKKKEVPEEKAVDRDEERSQVEAESKE